MNNETILINLILSGLLGLIGQGIRVVVGINKLQEESSTGNSENAKAVFNSKFDVKQLLLSLFIGFMAGCLAGLIRDDTEITKEVQMAIIAAGYAGTDFVEGILKKFLPSN